MYLISDFSQETAIKQHTRLVRGKLQVVKSHDRTEQDSKKKVIIGLAIGGIAIGAGLLAIKAVPKILDNTIVNTNKDLTQNLIQSASSSNKVIPKLSRLDLPDNDITIAINGVGEGFDPKTNGIARFIQRMSDDISESNSAKGYSSFQPNNIIPFSIPFKQDKLNPIDLFTQSNSSKLTSDKIIELTDTIKMYQKEYPNKKINILGHSFGGHVVTQAGLILEKEGKLKNINILAISAPNISKAYPKTNYMAIKHRKDGLLPEMVFSGKEDVIDGVGDHNAIYGNQKFIDILMDKLFKK